MYPIDIIMMCITACIGINMDIWESEPVNRREFGLKHYFMMDLTDRLFQVLSRRKLTEIKGELDRQGLFEDMVIECFHKGKKDLMSYLCQDSLDQCPMLINVNQFDQQCIVDPYVDQGWLVLPINANQCGLILLHMDQCQNFDRY